MTEQPDARALAERRIAQDLLDAAVCRVPSHDAPGSLFCAECGHKPLTMISAALASSAAEARRKAFEEAAVAEQELPVTYRRINGKGPIYAVYGSSSNDYADALEARIKELETKLENCEGEIKEYGLNVEGC